MLLVCAIEKKTSLCSESLLEKYSLCRCPFLYVFSGIFILVNRNFVFLLLNSYFFNNFRVLKALAFLCCIFHASAYRINGYIASGSMCMLIPREFWRKRQNANHSIWLFCKSICKRCWVYCMCVYFKHKLSIFFGGVCMPVPVWCHAFCVNEFIVIV